MHEIIWEDFVFTNLGGWQCFYPVPGKPISHRIEGGNVFPLIYDFEMQLCWKCTLAFGKFGP